MRISASESLSKVSRRIVVLAIAAIACAPLFAAQPWGPSKAPALSNPFNGLGHKDKMMPNMNAAIVTDNGPVKGVLAFGMEAYLGIAYAAPPVGNLRWTPPKSPGRFHGVFQADTFGPGCVQPDGIGGTLGSEDCLKLNVFTPIQKKNAHKHGGLPVMVFLHGGGLVTGLSFSYDPSPLVDTGDVIVVTLDYRLGFLGFFAQSSIDGEGHTNGNYGLMDQQFALQWVRRNIGAFGGDPNRVTLFGQSGGGLSVYAHMSSPTATGLFHGAISESGAYAEFQDYFNLILPIADGEVGGALISDAVGCVTQSSACLRTVPAAAFVALQPAEVFPFVDGALLPLTPTQAFLSGNFNHVPVISGGTHDESRVFVADQYDWTGHPLLTPTDYHNAVEAEYGSLGIPGLAATIEFVVYPLIAYPNPGVALGSSETDFQFACSERNAVRLLSQRVATYAYEFNDENTPDLLARGNNLGMVVFPEPSFSLGAYHGSEIPYIFDIYQRFTGSDPFTADQQQLSATMVQYWTNFAASGDPNSAASPTWSPYNPLTDQFQSLTTPTVAPESGFDAFHKCSAFWSSF